MSEEQKQEERMTMVYAGDRLVSDKRRQQWLNVADLPNEGEEFPKQNFHTLDDNCTKRVGYWQSLYKHAMVGDIFSFVVKDKEKMVLQTGATTQRIGRWENEDDRAYWRAQDVATDAEIAARTKSKNDDLMELLRPFRNAYRRLGSMQRAQFLAKIVHHIVKGV